MRPRILAIDYDGTIVENSFPEPGTPMPGAMETLRRLRQAGYFLILWTCREDCEKRQYLTEAVELCAKHGVKFDGINETPRQYEFRDGGGRKAYADYYIDDKNIDGFPGWDWIATKFGV